MIEHNISTPKPARVKETFTLNNATIFGGRIFHFTGLKDDPLLAIKTGWPKMPDHTAFYHDIHRFDTAEKAGSLRPVLAALAGRAMDKRCILDFDSTVATVYGSQEGAETGYNNDKHGRLS